MQEHPGQFVFEDLRISISCEVSEFLAGLGICKNDAIDNLLKRPLTVVVPHGTAEIFSCNDGRCIDGPEIRVFNALLFEDDLSGFPVGLHYITMLPSDFVVGMNAFAGIDAFNG